MNNVPQFICIFHNGSRFKDVAVTQQAAEMAAHPGGSHEASSIINVDMLGSLMLTLHFKQACFWPSGH